MLKTVFLGEKDLIKKKYFYFVSNFKKEQIIYSPFKNSDINPPILKIA